MKTATPTPRRTHDPCADLICAELHSDAGFAAAAALCGAGRRGSLTPIGASANIAAIGILRKNGETVRTKDFLRIGIPFTLAAVLTGCGCLWLVWG